MLVIKMTTRISAYIWMSTKTEELVASIDLLKIILQLIKISPSFNLDDGYDLDDGFETVSCRQTEFF